MPEAFASFHIRSHERLIKFHDAGMTAARITSMRRPLALLVALLLAMLWLPALLNATAAHAATTVTVTPSNENCNGIVPTPGSENTEKKLVGGDLQPGGTAVFQITYPVSASDFGQTFTVTDCPVLGGDVHGAQALQFSFVPNNVSFTVQFTLVIPAGTPIGTSYCNYAKTTASPSASPSSNRKAGPACFTVGGNLLIEKHATGSTALLPGAHFSVSCPTAAPQDPIVESPVVVTGLVDGSSNPVAASYVTADGAWEAAGTADPGSIGIAGPSGTDCAVAETAAPPGYVLPATTPPRPPPPPVPRAPGAHTPPTPPGGGAPGGVSLALLPPPANNLVTGVRGG